MKTPIRSILINSAALVALTLPVNAQTVWDGNGTPDASGSWNDANNWSTDSVPSAVAVELNDVTTGTRTVTLDTTSSSNSTLTLNQSTAGATNALEISGTSLTLTNNVTSPLAVNQAAGNVAIRVVGGGSIILNSTGSKTFTNPGSFVLGDATGPSSGSFTQTPASLAPVFTFSNSGTATFNNDSTLGINSGASGGASMALNNSGTMNFAGGTGTGIRAGVINTNSNPSPQPVLTNNLGATVNVTRIGTAVSGTGNSSFGTFDTNNQRTGARIENNGQFNIAQNSSFTLQGRRLTTDTSTTRFNNNSGSVLTIGNSGSATDAGTLAIQITSAGGSGSSTSAGMFFTNAGTANVHGASSIRVGSGSASNADGGSLTVANTSIGTLNLYDSSTIGTSTRTTFFTNDGTLTKRNAGTAIIDSNSSGTNTNTGTIHIMGGQLEFTRALDSSSATSVLGFDLANSDISTALLDTPLGLTLGSSSGSTLELNFTAPLTGSHTYDLWDGTASGQFTDVSLFGSGFTGTFSGSPTFWTDNGYDFSLDYPTGILTTTPVPEPTTLTMVMAGLFVMIRRFRRTIS